MSNDENGKHCFLKCERSVSLGLCAENFTIFANLTLSVYHGNNFRGRVKIFHTLLVQTFDFWLIISWMYLAEVKLRLTACL